MTDDKESIRAAGEALIKEMQQVEIQRFALREMKAIARMMPAGSKVGDIVPYVRASIEIATVAKEIPPFGASIDAYLDWIRKLRKMVE